VSDEEKTTKAQRREAARDQRREAEQAAAKAAARSRRNTTLAVVGGGAALAGLIFLATMGNDPEILEDTILVSASQAEAGRAAAGCEVLAEDAPLPDATHHDPATAPPAEALYTSIRPTHSGPHFTAVHPLITGGASSQLEERATTHNLEHGAIIAWYEPDKLDGAAVGELEALAESLNGNGFGNASSGAALFVSPYTDPGISSGKALAIRAWGNAMDCDTYDESALLAFMLNEYGTHGRAPEGNFSPFPEAVLQYDPEDTPADFDPEADPLSESRTGGEAPDVLQTDADGNIITDAPTDASDDPAAGTDPASDEPAADASEGDGS